MSWGPRNVPVLLRYKSCPRYRTGIGWLTRAVLTWNFRGFKTCWINSWCYCYFHKNHTLTLLSGTLTLLASAVYDDSSILDCKDNAFFGYTNRINTKNHFKWKFCWIILIKNLKHQFIIYVSLPLLSIVIWRKFWEINMKQPTYLHKIVWNADKQRLWAIR